MAVRLVQCQVINVVCKMIINYKKKYRVRGASWILCVERQRQITEKNLNELNLLQKEKRKPRQLRNVLSFAVKGRISSRLVNIGTYLRNVGWALIKISRKVMEPRWLYVGYVRNTAWWHVKNRLGQMWFGTFLSFLPPTCESLILLLIMW